MADQQINQHWTALADSLPDIAARARAAGVFRNVSISPDGLLCPAMNPAATYRLMPADNGVYVALQTPDRWLSQSIEQDLVHTGDKLDELIEEEMVDLGYRGPRLGFEHFRSEDKQFTFRSRLPSSCSADVAVLALLGYEACFRRLGDVDGGEDES